MHEDLKKIFSRQLKAEITVDSEDNLKSYGTKTFFGRTISTKDKLLFAFIVERILGTQVQMTYVMLTERDFPDLSRKYTLDQSLTEKQMETNKYSVGMPVFIKDKVLNEYLYLKGIKK